MYKTTLILSTLLPVFFLGQAHAHTNVMDFDTPAMPPAVIGGIGQVYSQNGFETTSIDFETGFNSSHVHGAFVGGSRLSQLEAGAGGALFRASSGENFRFESFSLVRLDTDFVDPGTGRTAVTGRA